ncbi:patatin [gamma proteobacterium HTCC5015]|nr:patatin [gamma proteobacterium HTCC5015]
MAAKLRKLEKAIKNAATYEEWRAACAEHDRLSGADEWKQVDHSPFYDYELIRARLSELRRARKKRDGHQLVFHLHEGLHGNLGNISNPMLYKQSKLGTKRLIEEYLDEVCTSLHFVCDNEFANLDFKKKIDFFETVGQAFGRSALMLSGGAALGLFHLGVVKALWEHDLLPKVISGSSAGSIVAAAVGTHKDDELEAKLEPENLYMTAFKYIGWTGIFKGRPILDGDHLEVCLQENIADMTFEEAYRETGLEINVTVSPYDRHQQSRLLNWRTSPHVLIRKAVLASCAVPAIFPPVTLWAKNVHGEKVPYIPTRKWVDGSVNDDLPVGRLARLYGVNHTIVSQTNPHVVPFITRDEKAPGPFNLLRTFAVRNVQLNAKLSLEVIQSRIKNNDIALLFDKAHSVAQQKYIGDINIIPPRRPSNILKIFKNPTVEDVRAFIKNGERTTWPKLDMIRNTTRISSTFTECREKLDRIEAEKLERLKLVSVK